MSSADRDHAEDLTSPSTSARRRWLVRLVRRTAALVVVLLVTLPVALGFITTWTLTHHPCGGGSPPESQGLTSGEAVTFPAPMLDREVRGYFVGGTNGVTILLPPALNSGAGYWLPEYVVLNRNGYSLFNYESRNCVGYSNSLGYLEVDQVGDALDYLAQRPDVDAERIGIAGFSAAGATSLMAAARYPQIKAVIAMGGYHDFGATLDAQAGNTWYGPLYGLGAKLGYRLATGADMAQLSPVSVIDRIAPRPILLIYGTREPSLPGAYLEQQAAGPNASLWVEENATHGTYWVNAPDAFEARVVDFLDAAFDVRR